MFATATGPSAWDLDRAVPRVASKRLALRHSYFAVVRHVVCLSASASHLRIAAHSSFITCPLFLFFLFRLVITICRDRVRGCGVECVFVAF